LGKRRGIIISLSKGVFFYNLFPLYASINCDKVIFMSTEVDTEKQKNARLIIFFFVGVLLFNYPILSLFSDKEGEIFGIPILYAFVFSTWAVFIILTAFNIGFPRRKASSPE
jgi:hypothetical protein